MRKPRHVGFQARLSFLVNHVLIDDDQAHLYDRAMIGSRFRKARLSKNLTLREVGALIGVTPQAVGQWEKTNPQFTVARTAMLANILHVDYLWLEGEEGNDDEIMYVNQQKNIRYDVPIVNKLEALSFSMFSTGKSVPTDDFKKGSLYPSAKIIGRGFAFEMDDDSMQPMLNRDDLLIFDPAVKPTDDDIVFAVVNEQGGTFAPVIRLYKNLGDTAEGDAKISLHATNEFHKSYVLNDGYFGMVFAVLVELRLVRPKGWRLSS